MATVARPVESKAERVYCFNNCRGRNHLGLFGRDTLGRDAFYDLGVHGFQADQATDLYDGHWCVVATRLRPGEDVTFRWYRYRRAQEMLDDQNIPQRVLFGDLVDWETLSQAEAAHHELYARFFNRNGHFRQESTHFRVIPRNLLPPRVRAALTA